MDNWIISEDGFDTTILNSKETVFTIGNGYLGTRGTFEEGFPGETSATLLHGVFDDVPIGFTELANTPNWLDLRIYVNGEVFRLNEGKVLSYKRALNLRTATLHREVTWLSPAGNTLRFEFERFASLANEHQLALRCRITSLDYCGRLEIRASLAGHVENNGWTHWNWQEQGKTEEHIAYLCLRTRKTGITLCEAFELNLVGDVPLEEDFWDSLGAPEKVLKTSLQVGQSVSVEKLVSVFTSRDTTEPKSSAIEMLRSIRAKGYEGLWAEHRSVWEDEWKVSNIIIEGDDEADRAMRYSLFQLLIAAPRHDERVSIAAKSLSGFGYRGHTFWDTEIFILPFFTFTHPEIANNLLRYRYHTLEGARKKAKEKGCEGACYAWESAATGEETTPRWALLPNGELVHIWCGDIELHITVDVVFAIDQYWQITGDDNFMLNFGAEIILDAARFWGSRVEWNAKLDRYEINDVIGPDENHDHVNNNAYTNNLVRWNLKKALEIFEWLRTTDPEKANLLEKRLDLTPARLAGWQKIIEKIYTGFDEDTGLFEQFEGYYNLKQLDLPSLEPRTQSVQSMLGIEGGQKVQVIKQPDVLMLLYLLDHDYDDEILRVNWNYYAHRTDLTYGSSLGPPIQAIMATRVGDIEQAYRLFMLAARTDLEDMRGNAAEGIHAATHGGLWQACVIGFGGLKFTPEGAVASPHLPAGWKRLKFGIQYRGERFEFDLRADSEREAQSVKPKGQEKEISGKKPQMKISISGAIFDLDGVITDTSEFHYLAWKRLADEEGIPFDRSKNDALRGISRFESLQKILDGRILSDEQTQILMERKNNYYLEYLTRLNATNLLPGVLDFIKDAKQQGIKLAVGSASKNTHLVLEKLGIFDLFDAVSDGFSVTRVKPAPDLFFHAANQLHIQPEHCIVFEDAEAGIKAALDGNFWVVGIGPEDRVGTAHLVISGFDGLNWKTLIERLDKE
ncbi:MAG: beta-phosphoglucomutase [Anaerolineaceae bacterium]|jgi:kojibiose phosphorylase|nr:MAG: beta-phosphoglucomutase [Anaerolineaceae bacterium]